MKKLVIIGFGNQAKAWALNLRDSGWDVLIGLRSNSTSMDLIKELGFNFISLEKIPENSKIAVLTPDDSHFEIVQKISQFTKSAQFIYAHGYSLEYTSLTKEFNSYDHILLAPKAIASELRYEYETKGKNGGVYSFEYLKNNSNKDFFLNLAKDLGLTSVYEATISDETKADLFSEQSLLCSTLPYAALYSFNELRRNGVSQEVAFFECWHEVKLIANTLIKLGPEEFFKLISPNALIGSEIGHQCLFDREYLKKLNDIYQSIENGSFNDNLSKIDINKVRSEINNFWSKQELSQVYKNLKDGLY